MNTSLDIKNMFLESKALLEGHFVLSSGLHSSFYMQSAKVLQNPKTAELFGKIIALEMKKMNIETDIVVSPAMGGIIIGHEVARALGQNFLFTERVDGEMQLRRGFSLEKDAQVVIVEDVFTTGKSTREVIDLLTNLGANVVCCCSIVDRSGGTVKFSIPKISLLDLNIQNYEPSHCPLCAKGIEVQKPGSRFLKK
jgi:orotate phosphoribosyltransferase